MERNKALTLRQFQDEDEDLLRSWLNADHIAKWYEHPQDWLDEVEKRGGEYSFIHHYIAELDGAPIGFCQYYEYRKGGEDWHGDIDSEGAYSIDYLIGDPTCIGKGMGTEMIAALIGEIRRNADARIIIVKPDADNKASCGALLSSGFAFDSHNQLYCFTLSSDANGDAGLAGRI